MSNEQQAQWEAEAEEEARAADEQGRAESELAAPAGWAAQTWWPGCPWPEDVWANTLAEIEPKYVEAVKDPHLRTCISGVLMRHGWRLAEMEIIERLNEAGIVPPNDPS